MEWVDKVEDPKALATKTIIQQSKYPVSSPPIYTKNGTYRGIRVLNLKRRLPIIGQLMRRYDKIMWVKRED